MAAAVFKERAVGWTYVFVHMASACGLAALTVFLLRTSATGAFCLAVWFTALAALAFSLAAAVVPPSGMVRLARDLGRAWWYAGALTLAAMCLRALVRSSWDALNSAFSRWLVAAAFAGVKAVLQVFYTGVVADAATEVLGTPRFLVKVAGACSGIEGLCLTLVLTAGWLVYARRELKMRRAIWLLPASLLIWLLNIVRIAALVAIGDAGYPGAVIVGFHSEAGWIAFAVVAIGFLAAANRVPWFRTDAADPRPEEQEEEANIPAIYLSPFLAMLATSLLTRVVSAGFEWLYPLRTVAGLACLWWFRKAYLRTDWRFGWLGVAAGAAVGGLWIALDHDTNSAIANGLASLTYAERTGWTAARVFAAVLAVPVAEELAFRGFLARWLVTRDSEEVESVSYRQLGWFPIVASSLAFGVLHSHLWLLGTLAGVVFAWVAKQRGRLGEAVAAHATANLSIAVWVLWRGAYGLW